MEAKIHVNTTVVGSTVESRMDLQIGEAMQHLSTQAIDLSDAGVRQALVSLGWTPPNEQPAQQEPTDSMGIPVSCGKPLCSPGNHHPLCKLAEQPAPAQEPVLFSELAKRRVLDYIRGAYDLGYNDARNAKAIRGDSATGYKGREVEADHGVALLHSLQSLYTTPPAPAQPLTWVSVKDRLPPVDEDVLTYDVTYPDDGFDIERRLSEREWSVKYSVTHWMPLPDAPKAAHGIKEGGGV